jgi:hypothetical protein
MLVMFREMTEKYQYRILDESPDYFSNSLCSSHFGLAISSDYGLVTHLIYGEAALIGTSLCFEPDYANSENDLESDSVSSVDSLQQLLDSVFQDLTSIGITPSEENESFSIIGECFTMKTFDLCRVL